MGIIQTFKLVLLFLFPVTDMEDLKNQTKMVIENVKNY